MDIRIARSLMLTAQQQCGAAAALLEQVTADAKEFASDPEIVRHAENAAPALKAAVRMASEAQDALGEIMREHERDLANARGPAGHPVEPSETPENDG